MAIKRMKITEDYKLSESQLLMLEEAADSPIEFDEDCPAQTAEQLAKFRRVPKGQALGLMKEVVGASTR